MARSQEIQERITAFARQLSEELGEVDDSEALSWLDAMYAYGLLVRYNRRKGYENGQIRWIIDSF
mgnify:CR=1 FL=1